MTLHEPKFKKNDLVMFARSVQCTTVGMRVEEVDSNMFDSRLKVNGLWWHEECFTSFDQWLEDCKMEKKK